MPEKNEIQLKSGLRAGKIYNVKSLQLRTNPEGLEKLRELMKDDGLALRAIEAPREATLALRSGVPEGGIKLGTFADVSDDAQTRAVKGVSTGMITRAISTSTSQDDWGTALTLPALRQVAEAFASEDGRITLHSHFENNVSYQGVSDYKNAMGRTMGVQLKAANVARSVRADGQDYVLEVDWKIYEDDPNGADIARRLRRGQPISRSIGYWMDEIQPVYDEDDWLILILVHSLAVIDHDSATRFPANPDCTNMEIIQDKIATRATPKDDAQTRTGNPDSADVADNVDETAADNDSDSGASEEEPEIQPSTRRAHNVEDVASAVFSEIARRISQ